jgi:hypothetical protein
MAYRRLFIWVEGADDVRFFEEVAKPLFDQRYDSVIIRPYSAEKPEKVNSFLRSIKAMKADYLFVTDINSDPCVRDRKQRRLDRYQNLEADRIVVVVKEIESWYFAGLDGVSSKRLGVTSLTKTNTLTKEAFNTHIPSKFDSRTDFMLETLKCFSVPVARGKNKSFDYFMAKHCVTGDTGSER